MSVFHFGNKLAAYRRSANMTIRELSEKTGLSTAILSQLERNIGNPSLTVLQTIAEEMSMSVSELVAEELEIDHLLLRKADRQQTYNPDNQYMFYDVLTPGTMRSRIEMTLVHCAPHAETFNKEFHMHHTEEVVYVLSGKLQAVLESTTINIEEGDTLRIPAGYKHRYINHTDEPVELLTVEVL